jgi:hypothetical protein
MDAKLRIITRLPLEELWRDGEFAFTQRRRGFTADDIVLLLQFGVVEFVVADVGSKLCWITPTDCYDFWKTEVKPHLAGYDSRVVLGDFPDGYCYFASQWEGTSAAQAIILLERHH